MAYKTGGDTVVVNAIIENPKLHEVTAKLILETIDGTFSDSVDMFQPDLNDAKKWQAKWKTNETESIYWLSVKATNNTERTFFTNKHATRFSTLPLRLEKITASQYNATTFKFSTGCKNLSNKADIINLTFNLKSNDPWIKSISPKQLALSYIKPSQMRETGIYTVTIDEATFPKYFNLTFNVAMDGWPYWAFDTTIAIVPTGIEQVTLFPVESGLEQNYPNPFNSVTTINWQLAKSSKVTLKVIDIVGRTVATLVDGQRPQGKYETQFNAATLPNGIYFYQLKAGEFKQTRKMILME
jgi:hypothetical protein